MKPLIILLLVFILSQSIPARAADPWGDQPTLSALRHAATTAMGEYRSWAEGWAKVNQSSDQTMNAMTEATLLAMRYALDAHPNPELLEQCLLFIGTNVPPEFDDLWGMTRLEMSSLDEAITKKVNDQLKAKNLPTLEERGRRR